MNFKLITLLLASPSGSPELLLIDGMARRFVEALFDRDRLVTGKR
jgi:hypothetical protein